MTCTQIQLELPGFLYGELDDDAKQRVEAHLASCSQCAAEVESLKRTMSRLDEWEMPSFAAADDRSDSKQSAIAPRPAAKMLRPILTGTIAATLVFGTLAMLGASVTRSDAGWSVAFGAAKPTAEPDSGGQSSFLLVLHEDPQEAMAIPPEKIPVIVHEYSRWAGELAEQGKLLRGQKLTDEPGKIVSAPRERLAVAVRDGSWHDANDIVTGFFEIRASSYEEAIEITKTCPHLKYGKHIELRQIDDTN